MEKHDEGQGFGEHLDRIRTAGSVNISAELFEKLYLSPENRVAGDLRKTFANPTPIALGGGLGAAMSGSYYYFGGMLLLLGGIGEWILGNNFPATVFTTFGSFWFTFGATLTPLYNAYGAYSPDPTNPEAGKASAMFMSTYAYFLLSMAILCLVYLIASIRTNVVFFLIFLLIVPTFGCLAGSFWHQAAGRMELGMKLQTAGASMALGVSILGWYIFLALVLAGIDFPVQLPVFDLSTIIKGKSDMAKSKRSDDSPA